MIKNCKYIYLLIVLCLSCSKPGQIALEQVDVPNIYDVVLIMGQSNTHHGLWIDESVDIYHPDVLQLGRSGSRDLQVLAAEEPLDHHTKNDKRIGFSNVFSNLYVDELLSKDKRLLLIPCGYAGSSLHENNWNEGDELFEDAIRRTHYVLENFPGSELKCVLWHQGESDVHNDDYQLMLDEMIVNFRSRIGKENLLFLMGGMVPQWVETSEKAQRIQEIILHTPSRISHTGYVSPTFPFVIEADEFDVIHFNAKGQRELGKRYFDKYKEMKD